MFEMVSNSLCNIRNKFVTELFERDPFKNKYHSRLIFCGESKSGLEIKEFPVEMLFPGGGGRVPLFWSTHTHTHDRLDKLRSALAEAQLKKCEGYGTFIDSQALACNFSHHHHAFNLCIRKRCCYNICHHVTHYATLRRRPNRLTRKTWFRNNGNH